MPRPSTSALTPKRTFVPGCAARSAILIAGPEPSLMAPMVESKAPFAGSIVINVLVSGGGGGGKPPAPNVEANKAPVEVNASPVNLATPFG